MKQLTKEEAINLYESKIWESWTYDEIVRFQLFQNRLAIPFEKFHEAMENVLNRPIFTHEFAYRDLLIDEYQKAKPAPTFEEILNLIPKDKLIIIGVEE